MVYRYFTVIAALLLFAGCSDKGFNQDMFHGVEEAGSTSLALETQVVIDFDHLLPNRIQNGSFELGIGAEPIYFGWRLRYLDDNMTPPGLPVIDHATAMDGNASVKIAHILPNHNLHIDFTPPDITDELDVGTITDDKTPTSYMYADLKTDCPGKLRFRFPWHDVRPTTEWKRYRAILRRNGGYDKPYHFVYDMVQRRIEIYNEGDQECTLWIDGLTWSVKDVGTDQHLRYAPVEAVFLPKRRNGMHFVDEGVTLRYAMRSEGNLGEVAAELHLRDLTRGGVDISSENGSARYVKKFTLRADEPIEDQIDLGHLKHGAYMAHIAIYDPKTKKLLGVARNRFTVMEDLRKVAPPIDFVVGTHGGLLTFGGFYEYSMRGSWDPDEFYETAYLTGLRVQRILMDPSYFVPKNGEYDLRLIRPAINKAHEHNCTTVFCIECFKTKKSDEEKPDRDKPGNWIYYDGVDITDHVYAGDNNPEKSVYRLPTDVMQELYRRVAREFGGKMLALENVNELNMFYRPQGMRQYAVADIFEPIYDIVKDEAPNLPIVADFTMDFYGGNFTTNFMDGNGTQYSDGFTYHPYGKTYVYYKSTKNGNIQKGISFIKRNEGYRDRYKNKHNLIMGMSEIHGVATRAGVGWDVMQRVLLDWSGGARFSTGILPGGLYFLEAGNANDWHKTYTKAPGIPLVALNAMHSILGGYKLVRRIDWDDPNNYGILIVLFQKPDTSEYVVTLCQGDFHHKKALLNVNLPDDTQAFDQWGEPIAVPTSPIKLSNEILYLKTNSPSIIHLFDDKSIIGWSNESNGYDYKEQAVDAFLPQPSDAWFKELLRTGIRPRIKRE